MIVIDASAAIEVVAGSPPTPLVLRIGTADSLHAPHLIDLEILHALRRWVLLEKVTVPRARSVRQRFGGLSITRYPHQPLADRIWALRANMTPYDAAYVALAEELGMPLVTVDERLGRAPGHRATIETF